MRFIARLLGILAVLGLGVIVGFLLAPAKQGLGTTVNYNFNDIPGGKNDEEPLGI